MAGRPAAPPDPGGTDGPALAARLRRVMRGPVALDHPLAPYTTYRVGGPADLALSPLDAEDLAAAAAELWRCGQGFEVLGGGSNVLVSDRGLRGVVVLTGGLRALRVQGARIVAGAGVPSHDVAEAARAAGLTGAEFLTRLPGSVGGACFMNARAYGGEVAGVLCQARLVGRDGAARDVPCRGADFGYKRSPFQGSGEVIVEVTLALRPGDPARIAARMAEIAASRDERHELEHPSCGCVFKNDHRVGVPAGQLIEACGLKGLREGDAVVSPHHANFVLNLGGASAAQLRRLIERVRQAVQQQTGHRLELEVRLLRLWEPEVICSADRPGDTGSGDHGR